eukprot:jgi/Tetstr1/425155/TSEL_015616.t1
MGEAGLSPRGAQAADEWDDVMSVDGDCRGGLGCPRLGSLFAVDPLLLGGAPVAAVPAHVMTRDGGSSQQSSSSKSGALQGGVELKKAKSNPLLGQWHNFVDRSHPNVRPSE